MKQPHHYRIKSDKLLGINGDTWQEKLAAEKQHKLEAERTAQEEKQNVVIVKQSASRCIIL